MEPQPDMSGPDGLVVLLRRLNDVLDDAQHLALVCRSPDEVTDWTCGLQQVRARVEALACNAVVACGSLDVPALSGQRTVASLINAHIGIDPRTITADQRLGVWLQGFGLFAEAFGAGRLTRRHVEALRGIENSRTRHHLLDAQSYLIEAAVNCVWREFTQVLRYWQLAFDPDGDEPTEQHNNRSCRLTKQPDGTLTGHFTLDPIAGQAVLSALQQEEQRLYRADTETNSLRTATQRRADALLNLITRGATPTNRTVPTPLVHLVFGADALNTALTGKDPSSGGPVNGERPEQRCELIDGTPIHPHHALGILAAATIRRLVLNTNSDILDLGRTTRTFPPKLKQALLTAARGTCQTPGCDPPFPWLQADHIHPWHHNGTTTTTNGQILCDPHNKTKRDTTNQDSTNPSRSDRGRSDPPG